MMNPDPELTRTLAELAEGFRDEIPVFRLRRRSLEEMEKEAEERARVFAGADARADLRLSSIRRRDQTVVHLPEGARLKVYHASGTLAARRGWSAFEERISDRAGEVDREVLTRQGVEAVGHLELDRSPENETLDFERLWLIKASGMTSKGERGATSVLRAVAAYRRVVEGLPVLGRASVFVKLAADGKVDGWGRDWRPVDGDAYDRARVVEPSVAAEAIVCELQTRLPGDEFTLDDLEPARLELGYLSLGKRRPQTFLQPVWAARLLPRGDMGVAHMIVVPAAPAPYEPICRVLQVPPPDATRRPTAAGPAEDNPRGRPA